MKILVSGCAGFIGFHLSNYLLKKNFNIIGLDSLNSYYDVNLKLSRLKILKKNNNFTFNKVDLLSKLKLRKVFDSHKPDYVLHMAAQAGVRYSIENPQAYIDSNVSGFFNIIDLSRSYDIKHFIYASSSSVYGGNKKIPFSTLDNVNHPVSLYAATKKSNELIAHSYSNIYLLPTTGLRFFTVYGPWGRPDMALYKFVSSIIKGKKIDIYNHGNHRRDFTYIDDVVECVSKVICKIPILNDKWEEQGGADSSFAPWKIYNIGNNNPVELMDFIKLIEKKLKKKAIIRYKDIQAGDVIETYADIEPAIHDLNFKPSTPIDIGINNFVDWYLEYYKSE